MVRRLLISAGLALLVAGCGSEASSGKDNSRLLTKQPAGKAVAVSQDASVVRAWADTLRRGDLDGAAALFAVPTRVQNGTPLLELRSRAAIRDFNHALPCGARVLRTVRHHGYVIATFRLVDRMGPGAVHPCGGKGAEASTAFKIVAGHIAEWRRVPTPAEQVPPAATDAA